MTAQFERMWAKRDLYRALFADATPYSLERYIDEFDVKLKCLIEYGVPAQDIDCGKNEF